MMNMVKSSKVVYGNVYEKSLKGREVEHITKFSTKKELITYVKKKYSNLGWSVKVEPHSTYVNFTLKYIG